MNTFIFSSSNGNKPPLVLLHGWGAGKALWANNFDELSEYHTIYCPDLLGFGRSSRIPFKGKTSMDARLWWVESLEEWRKQLGLEKFIITGHSLGSWIAIAYSIKYPSRVTKLIISSTPGIQESKPTSLSNWRMMLFNMYWNLPPQRFVRLFGHFGPRVIQAVKGHMVSFYPGHKDPQIVLSYIYHLNAAPGSGEFTFTKLMTWRGWLHSLHKEIVHIKSPTLVICGSDDYLLYHSKKLYELLESPKDIVVIPNVGHSPMSATYKQFNRAVLKFTKQEK